MARRRSRANGHTGPASAVAIGWCRVSTKEQASTNYSLKTQHKLITEFAARDAVALDGFGHGWRIDRWFTGEGESAYSGKRPEWQAMLEYVRQHPGKYGAILVYDLSRFSRNTLHQALAIQELRSLGVIVRSYCEPNIDDTAAGSLLRNMVGAMAEFQSATYAERARKAKKNSIEAGRYPWEPPCGYLPSATPGVPDIDPVQGELMRQLFEWVAEGEPVAHAHRQLQKRGLTCSRTRAHELLQHRIYIGETEWEGEVHAGVWEPLVPRRVWEAVQRRIQEPTHGDARAYGSHPDIFPAVGWLVCGGCGRPLTGDYAVRGKIPKPRAYYDCPCRGSHRTAECVRVIPEDMEAVLSDLLSRTRLCEEYAPKQVAAKWREEQGQQRERRRNAAARLTGLRTQRTDATNRWVSTTKPTLRRAAEALIEDLDGQIAATEAEISEYDAAIFDADAQVDDVFAFLYQRNLGVEWQTGSLTVRRALLRHVYPHKLTVIRTPDGIKIRTPLTACVYEVLAPNQAGSVGVASCVRESSNTAPGANRDVPPLRVVVPPLRDLAAQLGLIPAAGGVPPANPASHPRSSPHAPRNPLPRVDTNRDPNTLPRRTRTA